MHIRTGHVYLRPQHHSARRHLTRIHLSKQLEALLRRSVSIWGVLARCCWSTLLLCNLLCGLFVNISLALFNEFYRQIPQFLKIVRSIVYGSPLKAKPLYVTLDSLNILQIFLLRVGVIHTKIADSTIFSGNAKIKGNGLGVAYMQIAVRLWRETGLNFSSILTFRQILFNGFFYKIQAFS